MTNTVDTMERLSTNNVGMEDICTLTWRYHENNKDFSIPFKNMEVDNDMNISFEGNTYGISDFALSQMCSKLQVPVNYVKKCYQSGQKELGTNNLKAWLSNDDRQVFVRTYGDTVRGILSNKYSVLDSVEILDWLQNVPQINDYLIKGAYVSPDRLHLRLISPEPLAVPGEDLFPGVFIDNSDVGKSSVNIRFMIYKQVCTNGLVLPRQEGILFKQKHIGILKQDFITEINKNLQAFTDLTNRATQIVEETRKVVLSPIQVERALDKVKIDTRLGETHVENLRKYMEDMYGFTQWGFINAITDVAKAFTLDRRNELEKYAANFLIA